MIASAREIDQFGNKIDAMGAKTAATGAKIAAGFAVAATTLAAGLAVAVKGAADFEAAMRNVNSISGLSESAFLAQGAAVLDLSRQLPQSAKTLAEGLYEIASSGFQGAEGLQVLEESAKAASAGLTTTNNSAKAITAVLNAYGLSAQDAADVSDTLFQTVNLGVVSFEELTGVIGDTVGTAAAAGVGIDQVGAAIATMTLAGISGSEAGTSLNRVLQSLIDPGEELSLVLRSVGYESGASALQADCLRGVMMKLQEATGGNIESLLALFPEIRAARGALALLSNEGENYARVSDQIEDKNVRAGATSRALAEQMKSLSAQFKVFVNGINAGAIELGTRLLPVLGDALSAIENLTRGSLPGLQAGLAALGPLFRSVTEIGGDLADVARRLVDNLSPVGRALAGIVAAGVIEALNGLAAVLASITGFMASNETAVTALAISYGGLFAATKAADALLALPALFNAMSVGAAKAALGVGNLAATLTTLKGAAAGLGIAAAIVALTGAVTNLSSATSAARRTRDELLSGADLSSLEGMQAALRGINEEIRRADDTTSGGLFQQAFKAALDMLPFVDTGFTKASRTSQELDKTWKNLSAQARNLRLNLDAVGQQTGQTRESVATLAKTLGVDLTKSFDDSGDARAKLAASFRQMAADAYGGGQAVQKAGSVSVEALQAMAEATAETSKKVAEAFAGATDTVKGFTSDVAKTTGLKQFFADNIKEAEAFAAGIQNAARRGLDPAILKRLLEAGPEAAAPFLQAIASDHSGRLIALANETEKTLQGINTKVVAFARLTQQALNDSTSDQKVRDLGTAMAITAAQFDAGGTIAKQAIADKIGIPLAEVERIAKSFGITVGATAQPVQAAAGATGGFAVALGGLRSALEQNGPYVGEYTEGGKRNKAAIDAVIASIRDHMGALDRQGATMDEKRTVFNRHVEDLRTVLSQAGLTKQEIDALVGSLRSIEGTYRASIDIDSSAANATLDQLQARLRGLDAEIVASGPGGGRGAERAAVQERVDSGGGGYVSQEEANSAEGNIFRFYARGGIENHIAQIAPAATTRIWAEPETGGEAYIPLSPSKRGRSTQILSAVADEFGYGLVRLGGQTYDSGGFTPSMSRMASMPANQGIDYDRLGRAVAAPLARALAGIADRPVNVPLIIDGREFARATTGHITREMTGIRKSRS